MEVSRTKLRALGIDWTLNGSGSNAITSVPGALVDLGTNSRSGSLINASVVAGDFNGLISALRQDDLIKLLAEPTVVATHGRPARFNVGGRVPFLVPTGNGAVTIQYEEFGTSVDFLPFVVGPGRIRLEVRPEVTEPDASRGIIADGINVTGFTTRYVETAVEMQAGQTFAIAGLLQSRTEATIRRTPFLGELPYVGSLFRRVQERRNDIELLITVTPEFVDAMAAHEVPCGGPGLSTTSPSDKELYCKGYVEVPNLYGDCGCPQGPSTGMVVEDHAVAQGPQGTYIQSQPVVPGASPQVVGEGVTIEAPAQ
jgi:pilus assembly protein CpaC